jgi:hypothetical protein
MFAAGAKMLRIEARSPRDKSLHKLNDELFNDEVSCTPIEALS